MGRWVDQRPPCAKREPRCSSFSCSQVLFIWLCLTLLWPAQLRAEMSGDDYAPAAPPLGVAERETRARALAADRARAAQEQAERAARAAQEQALQQRLAQEAFSRLPQGTQILQTRCVQCHRADVARPGLHALPGWAWVALRMRWVHGAELPLAEVAPLVRHLAGAAAAPRRVTVQEWGAVVLTVAALAALMSTLRGAGRIAARLRCTVPGSKPGGRP